MPLRLRSQLHVGKNGAVCFMLNQIAHVYRIVYRQRGRVARMDKLGIRHTPDCPRDKVHDSQFGLGIAWRNVDNQPPAFTVEYAHQGIANQLVMRRLHPFVAFAL